MKVKENIKLALKSLKRLTLKKKIFVALEIVLLILMLAPFTFYLIYNHFEKIMETYQFDYKQVAIYGTTSKYEEYDKIISQYDNKHVTYIDKGKGAYLSAKDSVNNYSFVLQRGVKGFIPITTNGKTIEDKNDIICPEMFFEKFFYPDALSNNLIDFRKDIANETVVLKFYDEYTDTELVKEFYLKDTYNADAYYTYNSCFINNDTFEEIYDAMSYQNNYDENAMVMLYTLYVDETKNVAEVVNFLNENNIPNSVAFSMNDFIAYSLALSFFLLILMIVISSFLIMKFIKDYYEEEYRNIALYKALGFNNQDIINIIFWEIMCLLIFSLVVAFIIFIVVKIGLLIYFKRYISFRTMKIFFPIVPVIVYYAVLAFSSYKFLQIDINKIVDYSIKEIGEL